MKNNNHLRLGAFLLLSLSLIAVAFVSCTKNYYELYEMENGEGLSDYIKIEDWESVVPLAYGSLSLKDIMNQFDDEGKVNEYTDPGSDQNLLFLSFTQDVRSEAVDQFIEIDNEVYNNTINGSELPAGPPLTIRKPFNFNIVSFDKPRAIDKIKIKSGSLNINISSTFPSSGTIRFIPHIKTVDDNFAPYISKTYNIDNSGSWSVSDNIDITDHYVFTRNSPSLDSTYFVLEGELTLDGPGPFNAGHELTITTTLNNIEYSAIWGYFGNDTIINFQPDKIPIDLISDNDPWHFADPQISIQVNNSMGVPIRMKAQDVFVEAMNLSPTMEQLFFNGSDTFYLDVPYPHKYGKDTVFNKPLTDEIDYIKGSPGFVYVMNNDPKSMEYTTFAETNPNKVVDINQWLADTSSVDIRVLLDLPLYGLTKAWTITDTMPLSFGGDNSETYADFVEELVLRLDFTNGLPMDVSIQGIMIDSLGNEIDSLFDSGEEIIAPTAKTIKDDRVVEPNAYRTDVPTQKITNIVLQGDKIKNFFKMSELVFKISSTSWESQNNKYIRIYSFNTLDIKLAAKIRISGTTHFRDL
jgi:hypothetical protein